MESSAGSSKKRLPEIESDSVSTMAAVAKYASHRRVFTRPITSASRQQLRRHNEMADSHGDYRPRPADIAETARYPEGHPPNRYVNAIHVSVMGRRGLVYAQADVKQTAR